MKKLDSKQALLDLKKQLIVEKAKTKTRILVGISSCGIAAGAKDVLAKIEEILAARNLVDVKAEQAGCIGYCYIEPTVEIIKENGKSVLLGNVKPDDVQNIIDLHVVNDLQDSRYVIPASFKGCM